MAQIGFEGRVVTINVESYERTLSDDFRIEDKILYETIETLFKEYDAVFLEYYNTRPPMIGLIRDMVILRESIVGDTSYLTRSGFSVGIPGEGGDEN